MTTRNAFVTAALVGLLAGGPVLAAGQDQEKIALRFGPAEGTLLTYSLSSVINVDGKNFMGMDLGLNADSRGEIRLLAKPSSRDTVRADLTSPGIDVNIRLPEKVISQKLGATKGAGPRGRLQPDRQGRIHPQPRGPRGRQSLQRLHPPAPARLLPGLPGRAGGPGRELAREPAPDHPLSGHRYPGQPGHHLYPRRHPPGRRRTAGHHLGRLQGQRVGRQGPRRLPRASSKAKARARARSRSTSTGAISPSIASISRRTPRSS